MANKIHFDIKNNYSLNNDDNNNNNNNNNVFSSLNNDIVVVPPSVTSNYIQTINLPTVSKGIESTIASPNIMVTNNHTNFNNHLSSSHDHMHNLHFDDSQSASVTNASVIELTALGLLNQTKHNGSQVIPSNNLSDTIINKITEVALEDKAVLINNVQFEQLNEIIIDSLQQSVRPIVSKMLSNNTNLKSNEISNATNTISANVALNVQSQINANPSILSSKNDTTKAIASSIANTLVSSINPLNAKAGSQLTNLTSTIVNNTVQSIEQKTTPANLIANNIVASASVVNNINNLASAVVTGMIDKSRINNNKNNATVNINNNAYDISDKVNDLVKQIFDNVKPTYVPTFPTTNVNPIQEQIKYYSGFQRVISNLQERPLSSYEHFTQEGPISIIPSTTGSYNQSNRVMLESLLSSSRSISTPSMHLPPVQEHQFEPLDEKIKYYSLYVPDNVKPTVSVPVPVVKPTVSVPVPVVKPTVSVPVPVVKPTVSVPVPIVKPTISVPAPVVKPTVSISVPIVKPTVSVPVPVVKPTVSVPVPVVKPTVSVPVAAPSVTLTMNNTKAIVNTLQNKVATAINNDIIKKTVAIAPIAEHFTQRYGETSRFVDYKFIKYQDNNNNKVDFNELLNKHLYDIFDEMTHNMIASETPHDINAIVAKVNYGVFPFGVNNIISTTSKVTPIDEHHKEVSVEVCTNCKSVNSNKLMNVVANVVGSKLNDAIKIQVVNKSTPLPPVPSVKLPVPSNAASMSSVPAKVPAPVVKVPDPAPVVKISVPATVVKVPVPATVVKVPVPATVVKVPATVPVSVPVPVPVPVPVVKVSVPVVPAVPTSPTSTVVVKTIVPVSADVKDVKKLIVNAVNVSTTAVNEHFTNKSSKKNNDVYSILVMSIIGYMVYKYFLQSK